MRVTPFEGCSTSSAPANFAARDQISATFKCRRFEGGAPF